MKSREETIYQILHDTFGVDEFRRFTEGDNTPHA